MIYINFDMPEDAKRLLPYTVINDNDFNMGGASGSFGQNVSIRPLTELTKVARTTKTASLPTPNKFNADNSPVCVKGREGLNALPVRGD